MTDKKWRKETEEKESNGRSNFKNDRKTEEKETENVLKHREESHTCNMLQGEQRR